MQDLLIRPVAAALAAHLGVAEAMLVGLIAPPAKGQAADFALPCFQLAKARGVPPPQLATELAPLAEGALPGLRATATGPFLNLSLPPAAVAAALLPVLAAEPLLALRSTVGGGRSACIDFSSPNIAKHLAFHHIRSTMIGTRWRISTTRRAGRWCASTSSAIGAPPSAG